MQGLLDGPELFGRLLDTDQQQLPRVDPLRCEGRQMGPVRWPEKQQGLACNTVLLAPVPAQWPMTQGGAQTGAQQAPFKPASLGLQHLGDGAERPAAAGKFGVQHGVPGRQAAMRGWGQLVGLPDPSPGSSLSRGVWGEFGSSGSGSHGEANRSGFGLAAIKPAAVTV